MKLDILIYEATPLVQGRLVKRKCRVFHGCTHVIQYRPMPFTRPVVDFEMTNSRP
jgi:hypothetical protein